jgi:cytochrome P450
MTGTAVEFNPWADEQRFDPYPGYARLRAADPVHWCPHIKPGAWVLTRHADVTAAFKDPRFGRDVVRLLPPQLVPPVPQGQRSLFESVTRWMLWRDPPAHTRLRAIVGRAFTAKVAERLRPHARALAEGLIDAAAHRGGMDLIADFAVPLPCIVIAELLGVPVADRDRFKQWSYAVARGVDLNRPAAVVEAGSRAVDELGAYLRELFADRRRDPQDDFLTALLTPGENGDVLSEDDAVATCVMLLFAGHETTCNLIGNGVLALLRNPTEWERLRTDPGLRRTAVAELLRYDAPVQYAVRYAFETVTIGGKTIRKGQMVCLGMGAANRDPAVFPDPDRLDLARSPNPHVSLGMGIHYCIGAPLALAEAEEALGALLHRLPNLRLATDRLEWEDSMMLRGLKALTVAI